METELTPKQQASEAVRQARTILVATGAHPSNDQVAAVIALTSILRKFDKKVTAIISDQIPPALSFLSGETLDRSLSGQRDFILKVDLKKAEVDSLKYTIEDGKLNVHITPLKGGFAPSDVTFAYGAYKYDLAIVLGVATRARMDRVFTDNPQIMAEVPIVNFDFHRSNENYGAINLIDGNAASLCEMLVALSESLQTGLIDEPIATALLTGIIASTDRFTAIHTTPKSLTVAAQMMAAGAKQQLIVQNLYRGGGQKDDRKDGRDRGPRDGGNGGRPEPKPVVPTPSAPEVVEEAPVLPPTPVMVPSETLTIPRAPEAIPETPELSEDVPAVAAPNELVADPAPFFQGEGSVLATLPEVPVVTAQPILDPYQDPAVLAYTAEVHNTVGISL